MILKDTPIILNPPLYAKYDKIRCFSFSMIIVDFKWSKSVIFSNLVDPLSKIIFFCSFSIHRARDVIKMWFKEAHQKTKLTFYLNSTNIFDSWTKFHQTDVKRNVLFAINSSKNYRMVRKLTISPNHSSDFLPEVYIEKILKSLSDLS